MEKFNLVIRFKNLGTNDSILEHNKIVEKKGYVWGGWWAHSDEQLPLDKIAILQSISLERTITLFLVNSEINNIYPVVVSDIKFSHDRKKIPSPEIEYTPNYYKNHNLLLWFKIISIQQVINHNSVINEYSYCQYSSFKTSILHDYSVFDKKIISKINEFSMQSRTIFFIREKKGGDSEFDVNFRINKRVENISQQYFQVKGNSIMLLSDLHFSETGEHFAFADGKGEYIYSIKTLLQSVNEVCFDKDIASLLIAGDLTWSGRKKEYELSEQFILGLINQFQIDRKLITIVPGNHDINFNEKEYNEGDKVEIGYAEEKSKIGYRDFYKKIYGASPNEYLAVGRKVLLENCLPLDIVGLNSNCLQQNKNHFRGMGFIGNKQLKMIENEMGWNNSSYSYKILVLHHHLYPVEYIEEPTMDYSYSICLDAGLISSFIVRNKIDLVIHGHKHKEHFLEIGSNIIDNSIYRYNILGLGSAGSADLSHNTVNSVAILDFNEYGNIKIQILQVNNTDNSNPQVIFEHVLPIKAN